ncbi:DNA-binding protein WhiA [Lachnoclostridium sp. An181]|uniref:DNA-binding protein WhiA n=1 Tax=Lachnoclostridium sp. An181 TaxID=1965575 RepID=UPI000B372755|nr:DNA-binding protein WhiA [Lachnoclostridium sp. An181]OUP49511.1 DNA-binding protein WhiA [Lachnoclostridium sp. An181]
MSFSGEVKEELSRQWNRARHCQIAELSAIISMCGNVIFDSRNQMRLKIQTENLSVARKCFTLIQKGFNIRTDVAVRYNCEKGSISYLVAVGNPQDASRIIQAVKLKGTDGEIREELSIVRNIVIQNACCKRAFLRGAFLAGGSMSDPHKAYHLEIVCASEKKAEQIQQIMKSFEMDAKIVKRKKVYVVYLKEGTQIVDALNIMEAHVALMEFENVRILKEMRNTVNRKVNCETANINKTVSAAVKQLEDIKYIQNTIGFEKLSDGLRETAIARLGHPDATLKELGALLTPPVGKSGINHRLRKLSEIAGKVRESKEVLL